MQLGKLGIMAAAMFGMGLSALPADAQPRHPGEGRPGVHRPSHRPQVRPHHRKKRICRTVRRHGHRKRVCSYR